MKRLIPIFVSHIKIDPMYINRLLTLLLFFSLAFTGTSQVGALDSVAVEEPVAIANTDLSGKMLLVKEQLKSANRKLEPRKSIQKIDSLLPRYSEFLMKQEKAFLNFKKSHPNKQKVINIVNKWGSYYAFLGTWQNNINQYLDKNTMWLDQIIVMEKEWSLTYTAAIKQKTPYEVVSNIKETRNELRKIIKRVNKQSNEFLKLEVKILILKERINSVIEELNVWKKSEEFSIFEQRHPPIWKYSPIVKDKKEADHFDSWASFKENVVGTWSYLKSPENNLFSFIVVLIIISLWFWRLRKSFKENPVNHTDKKIVDAKILILNHLLPAIVFAVAVISIAYFSHTPNLLSELLLFVALFCAISLFRKGEKDTTLMSVIYFVILLYLMNTVKSYIWYSSILYRGYLAVEAILALVLVAKYTLPFYKGKKLEKGSRYKMALVLSPVLFLVFLSALVSNILGYTNFTDFLLKIGIEGSVLFLILTSMLTILGGLTAGTVYFYVSTLDVKDEKYSYYLQKRAQQLVVVFTYVFMISYFLQVLDVYEFIFDWVKDKLTEPIVWAGISFSLGNIVSFFVILIGSYAVTSFVSKSIDGGVLNFMKLAKGVPSIISVVIRYFLIAFAFVVALSTIGIDLSQFNLMAGALGLGIGFGLQNIISNFVSGLILIFERPVQTADVIEVGTLMGKVTKIGVRSSNVRTFDGAEVVVPNSNLISNEVINWTLSDSVKRMEVKIGAAYGTDLEQVIEILNSVAVGHDKVLKEPSPMALFDQFGDSSLDFRIRFWVPVEFALETKSEVSIAIYNEFCKAEITIPFPQRDINLPKNMLLNKEEELDEDSANLEETHEPKGESYSHESE